MVEINDRFIPAYEEIRKVIKTFPTVIKIEEILKLTVNKINPNPFIALAVIEIFKNKMIDRYIFGNERPVKITNREVRDLYDQLQIFFKRHLSSS